MSAEEWWATLLDGSIGAVASTLAVFAVFWFTIRHERTAEQSRRAVDSRQRRDERVAECVLGLVRHFLTVPPASDRDESQRWVNQGVAELAVLEVVAAPDHPNLSAWAGLAVMDLIEAAYQDEQASLLSGYGSDRSRHTGRTDEFARQVQARLQSWAVGPGRGRGGNPGDQSATFARADQ